MRTTEEALAEIMRRAEILKKERELRRLRIFSVLACVLTVGLIVFVSHVTADSMRNNNGVMGAFLLGPEVGAYVLVAIAALITGMVLSGVIYRSKELEGEKSAGNPRRDSAETERGDTAVPAAEKHKISC